MSSKEQDLQHQINQLIQVVNHLDAANIEAHDVLLSISEKLVASGQVFTRPEALEIKNSAARANEQRKEAHELIRQLMRGDEHGNSLGDP